MSVSTQISRAPVLRAVISAVNNAIGDRQLPELKLSVGLKSHSGQADVASVILNSLLLDLPRRLQIHFFEIVQRAAQATDGAIDYDTLTNLFKTTYGFTVRDLPLILKSFTMEHVGSGELRSVVGTFVSNGQTIQISGEGNGSISAVLNALNPYFDGTLTVREYSEHSIGEGSGVKAASYVELLYVREENGEQKRTGCWGVDIDEDISVSGVESSPECSRPSRTPAHSLDRNTLIIIFCLKVLYRANRAREIDLLPQKHVLRWHRDCEWRRKAKCKIAEIS